MATQHVTLPSQEVGNYVELPSNELDHKTKRRLITIAVVAVLVIIVVSCVAASIEYDWDNTDDSDMDWYWDDDKEVNGFGGEWKEITYEGEVNFVCGTRFDCYKPEPKHHEHFGSCFDNLNSTNCANLCDTKTKDDYDMKNAYYIPSLNQCYCDTYSQYYADNKCHNTTETVKKYGYVIMETAIAYGRPYYLDLKTMDHLRGDITEIDCKEYNYYPDDEWIAFVTQNHSNILTLDDLNEWINRGLSEHASIASFAKHTLELMSIGAPLWLIELSNKAGLDEIKHTQIAFDVANMIYGDIDHCIKPNMFPKHDIKIDGDLNKISKDIAIGGCIGETVSALTMSDQFKYDDTLSKYMNEIAMDEIRHSALAFVTIKWIIDTHSHDVDVSSREWWMNQNRKDSYIHNNVISLVLEKLWIDIEEVGGYEPFYKMVTQELGYYLKQGHVNSNQCNI